MRHLQTNAFKNQQGGVYVGEDRRGEHAQTALDWVRKYIESFPVVDGHYTRKRIPVGSRSQ